MKLRIINWLLSRVLKIKQVKHFIEIKDNNIYLDGEVIKLNELQNLKKEVELIRQIDCWNKVKDSLTNTAQDQIFNKSQDFQTMLNGKMILWTLQQIEAYFDSIVIKEKQAKEAQERQQKLIESAKKEYKKI